MPKQNQKPKRPKRDWHHTVVAILAGFMVLLMLLPMLGMILQYSASAATSDELQAQIDANRAKAADLNAQIKDLKDQLKGIQSDKNKALEQKQNLEQQINAQQQAIDEVTQTIAYYDQLIVEKEAEIADTKEKEAVQFDLFCARVRDMEEAGTVTYWDILFSSADFSDLLDRATFVSEIMEYDNAVMDQLAATRKTLEEQQQDLELTRTEQQGQKDELVRYQDELRSRKADVNTLIGEIKADEDKLKDAEAALQAEADKVTKDIANKQKALQALLASGQISFDPSTNWQWPIPGHYQITSLFAMRKHPITGKLGHHTGTDIAAPGGTPIQAAANGVVLISTYGSSYGNYVVIQHQDGIQTLYAHMSSRVAKEGEVVSQGQVIGYVGSTGSSTGNHLHLEFRVNGTRKDALAYYPSLTFDYSRC